MKQYDTYKDSGIAWIGEIPSGWEISRIKNVCIFCPSDDKSLVLDSMGYAPMNTVRYGSIDAGVINKDKLPSGLTYFANGDIVMAKVTPCFENGNIAIAKNLHNGCAYGSSELFVFRATHVMKEFLFYALQNEIFKGACCSTMTGTGGLKRVSPSFVYNASIAIPNINEQHSIASFLDTKCGEIDALISLQEEMISELQAYKQSVITEAVTKGLNPHAKMKDSGVEWIGEIPEGWNSAKLKNIIAFIESGVSVNAGLEDVGPNDVGVLKTSSVSRNVFMPQECKKVFDNEINRVSCPVTANTIIVSRMNTPELVGACGYVDRNYDNIFLPDRLWQVHFENNVIVKYYWYYLISKRIKNYFSSLSSGTSSSMQNISQPQFLNAPISIPPLPEQHSIATYLDEKTSQIDSLISLKQQKIEELKDYKKSIIYEYVTGKKRV